MYANFERMKEWIDLIALAVGGFFAGLINVVAGNGSAITLPLLMWVGLDPNTANATNRVGAIFQTSSAISSLPKTQRAKYMIKESYFIAPPIIIGAIIGANLAVDIPEDAMRISIGIIMIILLITMLTNPKKWLISTDGAKKKKNTWNLAELFRFGYLWWFYPNGLWNIFSVHCGLAGKICLERR